MESDKITKQDWKTTGRAISRPSMPAAAIPPTGRGAAPVNGGGADVLPMSGQFNCSEEFVRGVGVRPPLPPAPLSSPLPEWMA